MGGEIVIKIVAALAAAIVVYLVISSLTNKDGDSTGTCNGKCTSAGDGCIAVGDDCSQIVRFVDSPILTNCPTNKGCNFIGATTVGTCEGTCSDDQNGCTAALADCSGLTLFQNDSVRANCPVDSGCNFIVPPAPATVTDPALAALAGPTGTCTGNCSDDQNGCTAAQADCSGLQSFQESPVRANCPTDSGCTFTASTGSTENHEECENGAPCGGPPTPCKEARICHNKTCPPLTNKPDYVNLQPVDGAGAGVGVVGPDGVIRTPCNMLTDDREVDVVGVCSQGICVSNVDDDTIISDDGVDFQAVAVADWPTLSTTWIGEEATDGGGTGSWDPVQVVPGYIDVYALDDNGDIHHKPIQGGQPWYIWSYGPAGGATQIDVDGTSMWVTADDNTYHKLLSDTNYQQDSWTLVDDSGNGLHVSANGAYLWQVMDDGMFGASWDVGYKSGQVTDRTAPRPPRNYQTP